MNILKSALGAVFAAFVATSASALTIDNTAPWDGNVNSGWSGSGQSFTVDATENYLENMTFYFDSASAGRTFSFRVSDAFMGGVDYFTTSVVIAAGANTINIGAALAPGSLAYAIFDYNGYSGRTAHFNNTDGYAGGHSFFGNNSGYTGFDHRFAATLSGGGGTTTSDVPLPAGFPLVLAGLGMFALVKRRKS